MPSPETAYLNRQTATGRNLAARNTKLSYGSVARLFHWITALLILITFPLGMYAEGLPYDTSEALAFKAQVFSIHKTLGVLIFFTALARILWAFTGERPLPLHPERRIETFAAETVHWMLYLALVLVPLSGWIHHAATTGFAPILWPFGQDLPLIAKSELISGIFGASHWIFTKLLLLAFALHILGAVKHLLIDRDLVVARMTKGAIPPAPQTAKHSLAAPLTALALFVAAGGMATYVATSFAAPVGNSAAPTISTAAPAGAHPWTVTQGTLTFAVQQMGAKVDGSLPNWSAQIDFDDQSGTGTVTVEIDTTGLTLGAVTDQAKGPEFFDTSAHPNARFEGDISPAGEGYEAKGTLTLRGATVPVTLPFTLAINGDEAQMTGQTTLDRRDFGMGPSYNDEATVGFTVDVLIDLTAKRGG